MRKNIVDILLLGLSLTIIFLLFRACNDVEPIIHPITPNVSDSLKEVIKEQEKERDSLLVVAGKKDSVRIEYITKWRKLKGDTAYLPCDTVLNVVISTCDSIIAIDSALISDLKKVIKSDSSIIANCKKVMVNDSNTIVGLNQEIKKHKKHKKILAGVAVVAAGIAIIK